MPDLHFQVEAAEPVKYASSPMLGLRLRVENSGDEAIRSVTLQCQIRIETTRRSYSEAEQRRLRDLFGEPERWSRTLHSLLWTHAAMVIPPFRESTVVELPVPCTFDLTVATASSSTAWKAAARRSRCCSAARCFTKARKTGCRWNRFRGARRLRTRCR